MFTPIKNFITYIQKNASSNSIFGGSSTTVETNKMETENATTQTENRTQKKEEKNPKEVITVKEEQNDESKDSTVENEIAETKISMDRSILLEAENEETETTSTTTITSTSTVTENIERETETKTTIISTTTTTSTENFLQYEDEDIESQIGSSIMLKKPVKVATTNASEILEVKKTSNTSCTVVISHDINRNEALTPIDDELEDFRHDPTEVLGLTSSPCPTQEPIEEFRLVESADEAEEKERDRRLAEEFPTEGEDEEDDDIETEEDQKITDETDHENEKAAETEIEQNDVIKIDSDDNEEETFLDLDNYKNTNVIVLDEVDLNASTISTDTINTADDPLAIECDDEEAFAGDKVTALDELNLLNNLHTSHDEDTRTTADDDLQWLRTDLDDPQPSCSKDLLKENVSAVTPEKEERNGDGSDSGLGSETSALHLTATSITDTSQLNATAAATPAPTPTQTKIKDIENEKCSNLNLLQHTKTPPKDPTKPYRSNLKRRLEVSDLNSLGCLASTATTTRTTSTLSDKSCLNCSIEKKPKRSINFDNVQVYYFPRQQGFSCVPSAGGCTLGMGARHVAFKTLTLAEHASELRRAHRMQLQEINPRGSSSDDSEESEEDYLSEGSGSDLDGESNGFLQPVSPKQRRALLKAAGIRKIDPSEKAECRNIRNSREICGCTCRDFCDPETCACSQSGIKCQVDRDMFPCGCSRDACGNTIGRVEFNPARVRTHFIHTLMRLEMENRQLQNPYSSAVSSPSSMQPTAPVSYYQSHLQPQSNYSSGYASPAYNTAPELHQQTAATSYYHTTQPSTTNGLYGQQNSIEMAQNESATNTNTTTSLYGIDSLDTGLFGAASAVAPSYGELMPASSYHYGNVQTQSSAYYHNSGNYLHTNSTATTSLNTPHTYSSCSVPSIPPYGTATTTDATGIYHTVTNITNMETTTAPSCSVNGPASLDNDVVASFISLSTPLASSSRLTQINDLLQHNRNASNALVAVSQNNETVDLNSNTKSVYEETPVNANSDTQQQQAQSSLSLIATASSSLINIEDADKNCLVYDQIESPASKPAPVLDVFDGNEKEQSDAINSLVLTAPTEVFQDKLEETLALTKELPPQPTLCKDEKDSSTAAVAAALEPTSTIEVAAGK